MTEKNSLIAPIQPASFITPMLIGAAIGLAAISIFLFGVDSPDPSWPANWRVKPLLLTPLITAFGGAGVAFLRPMRRQNGWVMALGYVMSIIGFAFSVWIGLVLGLNGTMWD